MKVNVEIECSPEEARRFLGLPDVSKANDVYVDAVARAMQGVSSIDQLQGYAKQIASIMGIGIKTVDTHRQHLMTRLNLHSVAELTKYAIREGITSIEE